MNQAGDKAMVKSRIPILSILGFSGIIGAIGFLTWQHSRLMYPNPSTESVFLKNYSPEKIIKRFQCDEGSSIGRGAGAGAGHDYVTHTADFDVHFVSRKELYTPLSLALVDDAAEQLRSFGATIITHGVNLTGEYEFRYRLGNSIGWLKIYPVTADSPFAIRRVTSLPTNLVDTRARVEQKELWFPYPPSADRITLLSEMSQ